MSFVEKVGAWLVGLLLDWLLKRAKAQIEKHKNDEQLKKLNEENLKKYEDAKSRSERIKSALALVNREPNDEGTSSL